MNKAIMSLLFLALFVTSFSREIKKETPKDQIDNLLRWEEKFGFSGAVLVVKNGKVILSKGYGYANKKQVFSNTANTVFYIASVSKPITALGIMKLVEAKKISLKDAIVKYFPEVPENKKDITIEMLLTHTSGLDHTYSCDNITDRGEAIKTILTKTPFTAPAGKRYKYSGDNYSLLAAIIEIASGEQFERFITKNILAPVGIDHPAFPGEMHGLQLDDMASPLEHSAYKSLRNIQATWGRKGRAGMMLSVKDLYKIDKALLENTIFPPHVTDNILSAKISNTPGANYGYGFTLGTTARGTKLFGHTGDDDGVGHNIDYLHFPDEGIKIFIASNSGLYSGTSWSSVISSLLQRFLFASDFNYTANKLYYTEFTDHSSKKLSVLEGVYKNGNTDYHVWLNNNGQLVISPVGEEISEIFGYSKAYTEKNELTKLILEEAGQQQYNTLLQRTTNNTVFERMKSTIGGLWKSLEERNGPVEKIEILGTANTWSGNQQAEIATWFKLIFKNTSRLYRLEWNGHDKVAGFAGNRITYPMMFTMKAIAKNEFIGFDVANGRAIAVNFLSLDKDNKPIMELRCGKNKSLRVTNSGNQHLLPARSAAELLYRTVLTEGIPATFTTAAEIKEKPGRFNADEDEINEFGYKLLRQNKFDEAIALFSILVNAFPGSANGFDSLGEAHMKAGNKDEAIKNYKKSLELNPKNENARKMIDKMK